MAGKKEMLAELKVSPRAQFAKKSADWVKSNSDLKKLFASDIEYSQKLELDDGKWSEKKLSKALEGLVVYELKYLASAVGNAQKDVEKSPEKLKKIIDKDLPGALADTIKAIRKKCKNALEELQSSSGTADKKVLKEGFDVVRELSSVSLKGFFSAPAAEVVAAFDALYKELQKAERDEAIATDEEDDKKKRAFEKAAEKRRDNAFNRSARSIDQVLKKYRGASKEIHSAIDAVVGLRDSLSKKAEAQELQDFAKDVNKKIPAINKLQSEVHEFDGDIIEAYNDVASRKDDSDNIARKKGHFEKGAKSHDSAAEKARKEFVDLAAHFKRIEKKLK